MTKFWGSRFNSQSDSLADRFSYSISYDYRLAKYDVEGSIAHARMLESCKIIPKTDAKKIITGLKSILKEIESGSFKYDSKAEDIHTNIIDALKKKVGKAADRLHTARSRNDLIVLDMKMYCREESNNIIDLIRQLQSALLKCAQLNDSLIMPAYTHLQSAQVVLVAHHLLAYMEMIERDKGRLTDNLKRLNAMPLGSCALSGTSLPTDRKHVAKQLGFDHITRNSIDSVSDRDFIAETISHLAILGMHTSRIAEDLILWASTEFNFADIDGSLCTGSSIMPHKKNPDILELIRGETSTLYANLQQILVLLKGMPLTYNRDFQLDKRALFSSIEITKDVLELLTKTFKTLKFNKKKLKDSIEFEHFFTVDLMDYLIGKGVSYRDAHDTIGKMVKECDAKNQSLKDLPVETLKKYSKHFDVGIKKLLNADHSIKIKKSAGSTGHKSVKGQISFWKKQLK